MNWIEILLALFAGIAVGLLYFGGLWWTVNRLQEANRPLAFYLASFAMRLSMIVVLVLLVLQVNTVHLFVGILGFFLARLFLVYRSAHPKVRRFQTRADR